MSALGLLLMPVSGILQLIALAQILSLNFGALVCGGWGVCLGAIGVALLTCTRSRGLSYERPTEEERR